MEQTLENLTYEYKSVTAEIARLTSQLDKLQTARNNLQVRIDDKVRAMMGLPVYDDGADF